MRKKDALKIGIDYSEFDNPYTGLAAMVLVQAVNDFEAVRGKETRYRDGYQVRELEVEKFFESDWAELMADALKLDSRDVAAYPKKEENKD